MKKILLSLMFGPALFGAIAVSGAFAQGVILPVPCDSRPCRPRPIPQPLPNVLPVKSIKLDTKIEGQVATTHVEQVFRNDTRFTLEGTYFFPIPDGASVVEFAIWEDGKRLVGEVRSREEARRIYDEIVRRQRDPGLLEYAGKDLLQASIFPIPPNSDKKVELRYTQILKAESGTVAYRYPLGTGRNLWRGRPGAEAGVANMPPQFFGTVSGKIEIVGREPLRNIYSPSHAIEVNRRDDRRAVVSFESSDNDKDVQLFYGLSEGDFSMSLLTYREPGKDGYFLLTLSPRDDLGDREIAAKDIVFVLDTSGSMADAGKMTALKTATKSLLAQLKAAATNNGDVYVSIIPFAKDVNVGKSNFGASWIDWTDWEVDQGYCSKSKYKDPVSCAAHAGLWKLPNRNSWNGCITDRGLSASPSPAPLNYDQIVAAPGVTPASKFPAEQYNGCPAVMMGLSYDWAAMNTLVDQMQPNGSTNQPIGLVWAWQSLVGGGPLTAPAKDPNYIYSDVIILMSDGLNTQDRWYGNGYQVSQAVDNRMYQQGNGSGTCANAKAAGVIIYTVHVNTDGDPMSTLL
ncbi:MAG: VWA domain-containing protein, partial [Acidobacteria bacterium]|nr:VWA domain-containing protein [Acidobacteriota bacterium]